MVKKQTNEGIVGAPLPGLSLSNKSLSVVSATSQCSYSSTIVHVPHPESGTIHSWKILTRLTDF